MRLLRGMSLLVIGAVACGGGKKASTTTDDGPEFVAQNSDFAGFLGWFHGVLPPNQLSGIVYPPGTQVGFVNQRTSDSTYPKGTIVIKAIENPARDATNWEVFAFAKRGGDYNAAGAVGWEFFLLRVDHDGNPYITSRGLAPNVDGFDMGTGSYSPGGAAGSCNICHGLQDYAKSDHIISELMAPGSKLDAGALGPDLDMLPVNDAGYALFDMAQTDMLPPSPARLTH